MHRVTQDANITHDQVIFAQYVQCMVCVQTHTTHTTLEVVP